MYAYIHFFFHGNNIIMLITTVNAISIAKKNCKCY